VWPWKKTPESTNFLPLHWNNEVTIALCLIAIGFSVVFFLNLWAEKKD